MRVVRRPEFDAWLDGLRDRTARTRILTRIERLSAGLLGDAKSVGDGVSELRVHHGPSYRVYFTRVGDQLIVLLCGGDKDDQARDVERAKRIAKEVGDVG